MLIHLRRGLGHCISILCTATVPLGSKAIEQVIHPGMSGILLHIVAVAFAADMADGTKGTGNWELQAGTRDPEEQRDS